MAPLVFEILLLIEWECVYVLWHIFEIELNCYFIVKGKQMAPLVFEFLLLIEWEFVYVLWHIFEIEFLDWIIVF